jgi:hypothetical protein
MTTSTTIWDVKHVTDIAHGGGVQVCLTPATALDHNQENKCLWPTGLNRGVLTLELPEDVPFEAGQYRVTIEKIVS